MLNPRKPPALHPLTALSATALLFVLAACSFTPRSYDDGLERWKREAPRGAARSAESARDEVGAAGAAAGDSTHGAPPSDAASTSRDPRPVTLADHVREARRRSPALRAAAQTWRAALERMPQAVSLPDPRLSLGYFLDEVETRTGPMEWRLGVSQAFPWFGTLDASGEQAAAMAEAARERFVAAGFEVGSQVRDAWYEFAYLDAAIAVTRQHRELLSSWEEVAQIRYANGRGRDDDVIRAQVELGKLEDRVRTLEDLRLPVAARVNAVLDRAATTPLPVPDGRWPEPPALDEDELREQLWQSSPRMSALRHEQEAARHAIELADKQFFPDLSLGVDYTSIGSARGPGVSGSGDDAIAITMGIGLPLRRGRRNARLREAQARLGATSASLSAELNHLAAELEMALYRVRDAERRVGLYRDALVPKGHEAVESTTVSYQAGSAGFLELVDAERVLLEFELAASRAQADQLQALADVERLTGVSLFEESGS